MLLDAPPAPARKMKCEDVVVTAAPEITQVLADSSTDEIVRAEATVVGDATVPMSTCIPPSKKRLRSAVEPVVEARTTVVADEVYRTVR